MSSEFVIYIIILILAILCTLLTVTFVLLAIRMTSRKNILLFFTVNFLIINLIHIISYVILKYPTKDNHLINGTTASTPCKIQGVLLVFSAVSQEYWIASMVVIFYIIFIHGPHKIEANKTLWCCITFIVYNVVFLVLSFLLMIGNVIEPSNHYCWIDGDFKGEKVSGQIYTNLVYGIRWGAITVSIVFSIVIICKMHSLKTTLNEEAKQIKALWLKLVAYPIIQVVGAIIPTIFRIFSSLNSDPMKVITLFLGTFQGLLFPLCHGYSSGLLSYMCDKKQSSSGRNISLQERHNDQYLSELDESPMNLSLNESGQ